jgi:hypothetical protein
MQSFIGNSLVQIVQEAREDTFLHDNMTITAAATLPN